jgi:hypothetical protein
MWSLDEFRFDERIEADRVLLYGDEGSDVVARDTAITYAHSQGLALIEWWPHNPDDGEYPACVLAKVTLPVTWEQVPPREDIEWDERLWFEASCGNRDFLGMDNPHTFLGRMSAWCPDRNVWYRVSLAGMGEMSDEARYFVKGYLAGSEPGFDAVDGPDFVAWETAVRRFRGTGEWYGRWGTCESCGCVLLPDSRGPRCHEHTA